MSEGAVVGDDRGPSALSPLLAVRGVSKAFGHVQALSQVDFEVAPDETVALVGDNGAGKSTLIKILCGVLMPDTGTVLVDGEDVVLGSPRDARILGINVVYQDLALADNLPVAENIFLAHTPTRYLRVDRKRMRAEAAAILSQLSINVPSVRARVAMLSGGQRQGVALARAVHDGGRCLILDEPTAALGVQESRKVLGIIERLQERGITLLIVSHNLDHVFSIADRIVVLRAGRVVGSRRKDETSKTEVVHMIVGS